MIYQELNKIVDSVNDMKEATGAATFTEVKDKVERMAVFDSFKSPLAQLGYTAEDEAVYKDLKIDMTTVKEDVEYSKSKEKTDMGYAYRKFAGDKSLKYCPKLDISKTTELHGTFAQCSNLLTIPKFDLSNIKSFQDFLAGCNSLFTIPSFTITSKTTNVSSMFSNCNSVKSIDFSNWDTSSINGFYMFMYKNESIENVDVSGFNTSNATSLNSTFMYCSSLKSLDVSNWDISNVTDMNNFCYRCENLESLKINNFGVNKDVSIISMIQTCISLGSTEEGMESLRYTFITNSFDRAAAGYPAINLSMPDVVKARFTDEEKAAITAKGFTIA
jgi:surface protein